MLRARRHLLGFSLEYKRHKMKPSAQDGLVAKPGAFGVWKFLGQQVCFKGWCRLTGLSRQYVGKLLVHMRQGNTEPPMDKRTLRPRQDEPKVLLAVDTLC